MSTAEKVIIAVVLLALTVAVALLALTVHRASSTTADRATVRVHREALALHGQQLRALWRTQDQLAFRLARIEHDGGMR